MLKGPSPPNSNLGRLLARGLPHRRPSYDMVAHTVQTHGAFAKPMEGRGTSTNKVLAFRQDDDTLSEHPQSSPQGTDVGSGGQNGGS